MPHPLSGVVIRTLHEVFSKDGDSTLPGGGGFTNYYGIYPWAFRVPGPATLTS